MHTRVLVTGVTGFIGAHVADQFLQAGYTVVGTSRKAHKADKVKQYFLNKYGERFEVYESGDIEQEGAFDNAVKDVEIIAHLASPVVITAEDPIKEVINPAIAGTINILNSAHKYGKQVKHVIVTSSIFSATHADVPVGYVYTESDWNDLAYKIVQKKQPVDGGIAYAASKNEAERALWNFREQHKPSFRLTTILPALVFGPLIPPPETVEDLQRASTASFVIDFYSGKNRDVHIKGSFIGTDFANVIDVAQAHVLVVQEKVDGERFILSAGPYTFQEVVDILHKHYPIIAVGEPGVYNLPPNRCDGSKAERMLGFKYASLETTVLQTVNSVKHVIN